MILVEPLIIVARALFLQGFFYLIVLPGIMIAHLKFHSTGEEGIYHSRECNYLCHRSGRERGHQLLKKERTLTGRLIAPWCISLLSTNSFEEFCPQNCSPVILQLWEKNNFFWGFSAPEFLQKSVD